MPFKVGKPTNKQFVLTHNGKPYPVIVFEADVLDLDFLKKAPTESQEAPVMKQGSLSEVRPT